MGAQRKRRGNVCLLFLLPLALTTAELTAAQRVPQTEASPLAVDAGRREWKAVGTRFLRGPSPGCERKWLVVDGDSEASPSEPPAIPRRDLRMGLIRLHKTGVCDLVPSAFTQILYFIEGNIEAQLDEEMVRLEAGHVLRVPKDTSLRLEATTHSQWVVYQWAPGGNGSTLHGGSTMTEPVAVPADVQRRDDVHLVRYEPFLEDSFPTRFHARASDIAWTTNWTYGEALWSVYRYKPLVREPLRDWKGIRQDDVRMGVQALEVGASYPKHHHASPEIYFVLEGHARWQMGEQTIDAKSGTAIYTPPNASHGIESIGAIPLRWLYLWWAPNGNLSSFVNR